MPFLSDMATAVSRWCIYAKWDMAQCRNLEDYQENDKALPGMLILESEKYALGDNLEKLEKLEQKGVIIVFGCLENPKNIEKNQELMDFLGIYKVVSEKTKLTGVKLFEGLLLGGEVVYETPKEKEEKERQVVNPEGLQFIKMLYRTLLENEVNEKYVNQILDEAEKVMHSGSSVDAILSNVYQKMILKLGQPDTICVSGKKPRIIFFVGPTGVGKTATRS